LHLPLSCVSLGDIRRGKIITQGQSDDERAHYRAFISYSHADAGLAGWLHRKLESARLPDGDRLAPIFIDRAELAAAPDLSAQVRDALARSAALIVVASPAARASRWVDQEVRLFRELHPERPVLAALIAGEPAEAFPDALLQAAGASLEPLAADFREGQDGKRLGLLKIAAGLSGQPLDRLVQRDAQSRQRRVMAVTAGAVVLSIVLATLLAVAIRARNEAERQRAEAEGMVEFMLTDLRDKLKGVGSPKIMAAVNQRALDYYANQDLSNLSDESLDRRARVLHAMGEDDERLGNFPAAVEKYREARRITEAVLARRPQDPEAIFTHAQSEFWVGEAAWQTGDLDTAGTYWNAYARQAEALSKAEPGSKRALLELGYANGNLCELSARAGAETGKILDKCRKASEFMRQALRLDPGDAKVALALANRLGWLADAETRAGQYDAAIALRREEAGILDRLLKSDPDNRSYKERRLWPEVGIAATLSAKGEHRQAMALLKPLLAQYDALAKARPDDTALTEQQMRVTWMLARSAKKVAPGEVANWKARLVTLHSQLRRKRTPQQMERFDGMISKL